MKKGYVTNIEKDTIENTFFRKVLYTAPHMQLVLMSLAPGEDIGAEVHDLDQFIRIEAGEGKAVLNGITYPVEDGSAIVIPQGVEHNVINTGSTPLKLYSLYAPPEHIDGTIHETKAAAEAAHEHYNGIATE